MIRLNQNRLFLILLITFSFPLWADPKLPKEPLSPGFPGEEKKEDRDARGDTKRSVVQTLTLCDGRTVRGETEGLGTGISFQHLRDGIEYKKTLKWEEVESVRIDSWELKQKKEEKKGISYEALPKKVRIRTRSGETFYKETGLSDLKLLNLVIQNQNGTANLFTYWIDLKFENGAWYSGLPALKKEGLVREDCLKDVVRMIEWE